MYLQDLRLDPGQRDANPYKRGFGLAVINCALCFWWNGCTDARFHEGEVNNARRC